MKYLIYICTILFFVTEARAQVADYIVIKNKRGRTLKTYFAGSSMMAETRDGVQLLGIVKEFKNDTMWFQQRETRLVPTAFGTKVDSVIYTFQIRPDQLQRFMWGKQYVNGRRRGFTSFRIPELMIIAGEGFIALELANTLLSKQSIKERKSLPSLITAAGMAITGIAWKKIQRRRDQVGKRYFMEYIKAGSLHGKEK
jgi:hypothetical protein